MKKLKTIAGLGLLSCTLAQAAWAQEPESCKQVRFAEIGWADIAATTGVAMTLTEGLGYQPRKIMASVPIAFTGVKNSQIDVFLGYWAPSMDAVIEPFTKDGGVKVLPTPNLEGAKYTLAVPTYAADAGLKSFQDIAKFKDQLGGKIYGIEPGNDGNLLIEQMIKGDQYGLGGFRMVESSEAGMLVQVQRAVRKKEPVVFLGWAPHPMNTQYDITYLAGGDEVFGPDFGAAKVYTVVPPDYEARCANVGKLLNNLQFSVEIESQLMEKVLEKEDPAEVAKNWIKANPAMLDKWLAGVTTYDGQDAVAAVKKHVGL
ncbi:choline ABC transporter substrate-binding protein [Pseudomonas lalucatii]|uniref:Choline ABC transporter substrate-binding protein n=1 Tax=Pseudomonas lalucatii TaxID=1424203 RepID=A0ABS5Q6R7_9PSED|nr:choline ABC transporter substrate-binding protein [Pseudomonas lalucatii]MBS7664329.1 choline ABC transporter substrate-binding protein [Pseudomonas lalucatii]MBS7664336.1 choline ABC transporter substrate-binding protein [Pseudomonas lalucatii]MBS7690985.1 choline ABC transporter substrate-binding protein [Pseudomonas lalucatii]MBS7690989.1 choline ABC transporter substrate-binding protein [Pseudomonas lalucatii]MBS7725558.1 choline ABC transporter substrate-binding protein [Pseudomonas la